MEDKYLTVTALTKYIAFKFNCDKHLLDVLVSGEISNFKAHSRGHFYFTLKDDSCQIKCMMFQREASKVLFKPEEGMKVFLRGRVTVYEADGVYQLVVSEMKSDGVGDLYLKYEQLKKELAAKGYFDESHKKRIPSMPKCIGVITSPTGAAIHDIINTIRARYPFTRVILYPALVQGVEAKYSIFEQIRKANADNLCDVLIVGRGGGSIEDLWAFNEIEVAMAIYDSKLPIISAVGHEVDFTIADFVADKRAATPTQAAVIATPDIETLKAQIRYYYEELNKDIKFIFENYKLKLANLDKHIDNNNPYNKLKDKKKIIDNNLERLNLAINNLLIQKKNSFTLYTEKLKALNPLTIMDKGYSISKVNDRIVRSVKDVKENDTIKITLKDGIVSTKVMEVEKNGK